MKRRKDILRGGLCVAGMLVLILDGKTVLSGAKEGVDLCLYTVLPSLFPFLVLSVMINRMLVGKRIPILAPISKLCGIPTGCESLFLLGILGGYPVGAQCITDAYRSGSIPKSTAQRLLGFCNNAGPAFIFGILSRQFTIPGIPWFLWLCHILSAIVVGMFLPGKEDRSCNLQVAAPVSFTEAVSIALKTMANICSWVLLFRIVLSVLKYRVLSILPASIQTLIIGVLELTNGCVELSAITTQGSRFVAASFLLAFGGLCVGMQTVSATGNLGTGLYFPGKVIQCLCSTLIAGLLQFTVFPKNARWSIPFSLYLIPICMCVLYITFVQIQKKHLIPIKNHV